MPDAPELGPDPGDEPHPGATPPTQPSPRQPVTVKPSPRRILIVDGEPDVLETTAMLLEAFGYEPMCVSDPNLILDTIEQAKPALILQDLKMPGLNVSGLVA